MGTSVPHHMKQLLPQNPQRVPRIGVARRRVNDSATMFRYECRDAVQLYLPAPVGRTHPIRKVLTKHLNERAMDSNVRSEELCDYPQMYLKKQQAWLDGACSSNLRRVDRTSLLLYENIAINRRLLVHCY
jgi:hypothetical protein